MKNKKWLTKEEVDNEIKELNKRYDNGEEKDTDIYKMQKETLVELREVVVKGESEWKRIRQEIQTQAQTQT